MTESSREEEGATLARRWFRTNSATEHEAAQLYIKCYLSYINDETVMKMQEDARKIVSNLDICN
jgi:hypothetical protein